MKRALHKDFWMEIRRSKARFISIFCIVALGVAFFSGIQAASPDMRFSGDAYYDENNLMDIKVVGTMGLTEADVRALEAVDGVESAEGAYSTDVLCSREDTQKVLHVESVNETANRITASEGRLPEKSGECLLDKSFAENNGYAVGDTITFQQEDSELLLREDFTVVGVGSSPLYISFNRGNSTLGSGEVSGFAYVLPEDFDREIYTQIYLLVHGAEGLVSYSDAYDNLIGQITERVEGIEEERCMIRYEEVVEDAEEALADAEKELEDGKKEADKELEDAKKELEDGEKELEDGRKEYEDGVTALEDAKKELEDGRTALEDAKKELEDGRSQLASAKQQVADGWAQLTPAKNQVAAGWEEFHSGEAELESGRTELETYKQELADGKQKIEDAKAELEAQQAAIDKNSAAIAAGREQLTQTKAQLEAQKTELQGNLSEIAAAEAQIPKLQAAVDAAQAGVNSASAAVDAAQAAVSEAQGAADSAQAGVNEAQAAVDAALAEYDRIEAEVSAGNLTEEDLSAAQAAVEDARGNLGTAGQNLASAQEILGGAQQKLGEAQAAASAAEETLSTYSGQLQTVQQAAAKKSEIQSGIAQIEAGIAEAEKKQTELTANETKLAAGQQQIDQGWKQLEEEEAKLAPYETQIAEGEKELAAGEAQLAESRQQLESAQAQISSSEAQLESAQAQISANEQKLVSGEQEITENEQKLTDGEKEIAENEKKLEDAKKELEDGEKELADGQEEYEKAKEDAEKEIEDAEKEIEDARREIEDLKEPEWLVTDREALPEYSDYGDNADRIRSIGQVFPVIFFLVAALISLTTMTRMVEEQRTQIGTMKALGYGKYDIASKYLNYAFLATVGGSVTGILIGEKILPSIIITAYGIMFHNVADYMRVPYELKYALIASVAAIVCTIGATIFSCYKELADTPASLMRPPAPKDGKRVLLERIPFLWKHFSFTWKSTLRNLFRYKKRLFMTIFGIAGSMALMLVGFGIKDSISDVVGRQYTALQHYDGTIINDEDATAEENEQLLEYLESNEKISRFTQIHFANMRIPNGKSSLNAYVYVPEDLENFSEDVTLQNRTTGELYELTDDGAVISEKTASLLGLDIGDDIVLEWDNRQYSAKIAVITENYMGHYVYMTPKVYEETFGEQPEYADIVFTVQEEYEDELEAVGSLIMEYPAALSISYTKSLADQVERMLSTLGLVIVVLIVSAGMLAFVVLYNLNNINITERKRELATLKVLGFYDQEVSRYVLRENILLTFISMIVGAAFGILLHRFVIVTVEVDAVMFGRNIRPISFVYCGLLTIAFSAFVNFTMHFKLKKIDMVESLKSVE